MRSKRLYEKWKQDGERYKPYAKKAVERPWKLPPDALRVAGRGLHSSTSLLNLSLI